MYQHHEESLKIMTDFFKARPEVIAIVLGGSVAKGCERPDSDLDAMVIITPEAYEARAASNTTTETIGGMCNYRGGYFDIKYMTKEYIQKAAGKGSEPTRNSFLGGRVLYTLDDEIPAIVASIPVFQEGEYDDKMLSFYSNLSLNYDYFWKCCKAEGFMQTHAINEIIYSVYRMILQQNRILFPCNRRLEEFVGSTAHKPENILSLAKALMDKKDDASCDAFVQAFKDWTSYEPPKDYSQILSRYVNDYEQWWHIPRPLVAEW